MAPVRCGETIIETELVIFDKDGTLIDFDHLWGTRTVACVEELVEAVQGEPQLRAAMYDALGYDPGKRRTLGDGPLAVASMEKIYQVAREVLCGYGLVPEEARRTVDLAFRRGMTTIPSADLIRPLADVRQLVMRLVDAGVAVALATSDDRDATQATMELLGIDKWVSAIACGDDALTVKPAPEAILTICDRLDVDPSGAVMVGDTVADMQMGRAAGVGCRVAVLTGVERRQLIAAHADVVLDSVDQIGPLAG